jgi:SAM-dependent methyltransferase
MSRNEITEHAGYLRDEVKLAAYRAALAEVVRPGMTVLDLGAGTGILGLLAAETGARVVYAVDGGSIVAAARVVAQVNGYEDRIVGVRQLSTRLTLPEPVDVAVCDQIGGLAYDAGVLEYFHDARTRMLVPGGTLVPSLFQLFLAPAMTDFWMKTVGVWDTRPGGFDLSPMAEHAANTEFRVELKPPAFLAEPAEFAKVQADCDDPIRETAELRIERGGNLHGIAGMFVAQLSPSVTLTNCPLWSPFFQRWHTFYPLRRAVTVAPGDVIVAEFDVRPRSYITTWTVSVHPAASGARPIEQRASTVLGQLLTPDDLAVERGAAVPYHSPAVAADRYALELVTARDPSAR